MEDHRRTRSQGLSVGAQLIQWDSLQDSEVGEGSEHSN